jgi:DNA mismatch endonuclease (patch repair protein)
VVEVDIFEPRKRSEVMSRVRGKDTKPELRVRRHLHAAGLRYVLHDKRLPGKPDLSFPSRGMAVFVHGCFWHGHEGCRKATIPATRPEFWRAKIEANKARDARAKSELEAAGWDVIVVWECSLSASTLDKLAYRISEAKTHSPS